MKKECFISIYGKNSEETKERKLIGKSKFNFPELPRDLSYETVYTSINNKEISMKFSKCLQLSKSYIARFQK